MSNLNENKSFFVGDFDTSVFDINFFEEFLGNLESEIGIPATIDKKDKIEQEMIAVEKKLDYVDLEKFEDEILGDCDIDIDPISEFSRFLQNELSVAKIGLDAIFNLFKDSCLKNKEVVDYKLEKFHAERNSEYNHTIENMIYDSYVSASNIATENIRAYIEDRSDDFSYNVSSTVESNHNISYDAKYAIESALDNFVLQEMDKLDSNISHNLENYMDSKVADIKKALDAAN